MIEVTVKTLDSQNHNYTVPDDITVKAFKEKIAPSVGIPADKQRLIFCGRVLQDEKKLSEFDVHGKVIHLVQRPPPQAAGQSSSGSSNSTPAGPRTTIGNAREGGNFLLGAFTIPQDVIGAAQVEQIVQDVVSGMGEIGRNATVMSRTSDDGSSVDVHINLGYVPLQSAAQLRIQQCHTFLNRANRLLGTLESGVYNNGSSNNSPMQTDTESDETPRSNVEPMEENPTSATLTSSRSNPDLSAPSSSTPKLNEGQIKKEIPDTTNKTDEANERPKPAETQRLPADSGNNSESSSANGTNTGNSSNTGSNRRENNAPRAPLLGNLMEEVLRIQTRLQPHLQNFAQLLNSDAELNGNYMESQRLFNRVSHIMHYLSHIYHSISDLYVTFQSTPPRMVRASLLSSLPIPVMGQIQVGLADSTNQQANNVSNANETSPPNANMTSGPSQTETPLPGNLRVNTGGLLGVPPGVGQAVFNGPNPMVFMEVTPTAFTINSISGEVVNGNGESAAAAASSSAEGANTTPTTSGSTGTRTSAISTGPSSLRTLASIPLPGLANPFSFDPCLACNSRWAANSNRSQSRSRTNQQQASSMNNAASTNPPSSNTNTRGGQQQDSHLHQVISQLMNAFRTFTPGAATANPPHGLNTASATPTGNPSAASASAFFRTLASSNFGGEERGPRFSTSGPVRMDPSMAWIMEQMMQQRMPRSQNQDSNATSSTTSSTGASNTSASGRASEMQAEQDSIATILQTLMCQVTGVISGQRPMTVGEFVSQLEGYSYSEGESIVSDLFMCIAQVLTVTDLVGVFFGHVAPLNQLRSHLRQFVIQKILQMPVDSPVTNEHVRRGVEVILDQWKEHVVAACNEANVKPGIDYEASVMKFLRLKLYEILFFLINGNENDFGHQLYEMIRVAISELIVLSLECFSDREVSFKKIVQFGIQRMSSDVSPRLTDWMLDRVAREVNTFMDNVSLDPNTIQQYIVRTEEQSTSSTKVESTSIPPNTEETAMEVCEEVTKSKEQNLTCQSVNQTASASNGVSNEGLLSVTLPQSNRIENILPEAWHSAVPQEWVPIISCDVQRQRRQAPQTPFSDAYMSGMPSKRRRIMAESQEVQRPVSVVLPEALQRAIQSSGVQPVANMDCLIQEVTQDTNLHAAYREQVKSEVRARLATDRDYRPDCFPNSTRYFR